MKEGTIDHEVEVLSHAELVEDFRELLRGGSDGRRGRRCRRICGICYHWLLNYRRPI